MQNGQHQCEIGTSALGLALENVRRRHRSS
jgi:hypothetical protein